MPSADPTCQYVRSTLLAALMTSESKAVLPLLRYRKNRPIVFDAWQISTDAIEVRLRIRLVRTK
jgi:hypothetical protein